jgi:hypothetical protein
MCWSPRQQYMMDPIGVPFDKPIIQRMKPLNGILQIPAHYADTDTIFRGCLYWFPLIHRCQPAPPFNRTTIERAMQGGIWP